MLQKLLLPAFFLLMGPRLFSTHIVGGEIRYECLGYNGSTATGEYRVVLKVYRDCYNGVPWFDMPASLGIFSGQGILVNTVSLQPLTNDTIPIELDDPCLLDPNGLCVHVALYEATVSLPFEISGYYFVYQRCCRNEIINNILDPAQTGATYYVYASAEAQLTCNSSPDWSDYPPVTICLGKPITQDHSATDAENDEIVYSFCTPLTGGTFVMPQPVPPSGPPYDLVFFDTSYSAVNPMGGNPPVGINATTGLITGTPDRLGNFVIGVCGREFRNGVLLSEFSRDFQYIVSSCNQSRILTALDSTACDTALNQIDLIVGNGVPPYQFDWSNGATTEDLPNVTPGVPYTVTVTDAEGCSSVVTINGNDCVWPGDANYDGVANNEDILAIGLFYGDNGPVRLSPSLTWSPQRAAYWNAYQSNGVNSKHVDCDGSGSVNVFDTAAVVLNYNNSHPTAFNSEQSADAPVLSLHLVPPTFLPGSLATGFISLGTADLRATNVYGISFSIICDHPEVIMQDLPAEGTYNASAFGDPDHTVTIFKGFNQEGQFDFAICNTTRKSFQTLYGHVAAFSFGLVETDPGVTAHFYFENVRLIDDQGNLLPVNVENSQITAGLFDANTPDGTIQIYPNPASQTALLRFDRPLGEEVEIDILDISGRQMMSGTLDHSSGLMETPIEISAFPKGVYFIRVRDGGTVFAGKLIVE